MRVHVVGGGVIGLAAAWRLARDGHAVTLVDAAPEAREASWAAGGMLAPHHEATRLDALWRFGAWSLARWPAFVAELGGPAALDYRTDGGLVPLASAAEADAAQAQVQALTDAGIAVRHLPPAAAAALEPALAPPRGGCLWLPGGQVDPRRLLHALTQACASAQVTLRYATPVERILPDGLTLVSGERLPGELTVIAAGAWTPALARASAVALAGEPVKGQMVRLQAPDGLLGRFIHGHHGYLVPRRGAGIVVGATMVEAGFDKREDPAAIAQLVARARALCPALGAAPVAETWTGLRPRLAGGQPLVAQVRPHLILATGHFRNGILLAPATAEAVADLASARPVAEAVAPFARTPPLSDSAGTLR